MILGVKVFTDTKNKTHIGYKIEDYPKICKMFEKRSEMHVKFYQNIQVAGAEQLLVDALLEAEKAGFLFAGRKLTEIQEDLECYSQLDDGIIEKVMTSENPMLGKAKELLTRLIEKKLYRVIFQTENCVSF